MIGNARRGHDVCVAILCGLRCASTSEARDQDSLSLLQSCPQRGPTQTTTSKREYSLIEQAARRPASREAGPQITRRESSCRRFGVGLQTYFFFGFSSAASNAAISSPAFFFSCDEGTRCIARRFSSHGRAVMQRFPTPDVQRLADDGKAELPPPSETTTREDGGRVHERLRHGSHQVSTEESQRTDHRKRTGSFFAAPTWVSVSFGLALPRASTCLFL